MSAAPTPLSRQMRLAFVEQLPCAGTMQTSSLILTATLPGGCQPPHTPQRGGAGWAAAGDGAGWEALHRSGRKGSCGDRHAVPSADGHSAGRYCTCACAHPRAGWLHRVPAPGSRHPVCSPWSRMRGSSAWSETSPDHADAQCTQDGAVVLATVTVVMVGVGVFAVC